MTPEIQELIDKSTAVSSLPQVVTRFLEIIRKPDFKYDDLAAVLWTDPGTVADVLRLVNSALFGVTRKVTSLKHALTLLGPKRVCLLVIGRYLAQVMGKRQVGRLETEYYWRRSITSGILASHLAGHKFPRLREEAFLSALLADIGVCALAEGMPQKYAAACEAYGPYGPESIIDIESSAVGANHAEVSAAILERWRLPEVICGAVRLQHSELPPNADAEKIALVINAADRISRVLCEIPDVPKAADICSHAIRLVDVEAAVLVDVLGKIEKEILELAGLLKIQMSNAGTYQVIAQALQEKLMAPT